MALRVEDLDIILTENRMPAWDPDFLSRFRIEPEEKHVLVIRACGPESREISPNIIGVDTPGCFHSRLALPWIEQQNINPSYDCLEPRANGDP